MLTMRLELEKPVNGDKEATKLMHCATDVSFCNMSSHPRPSTQPLLASNADEGVNPEKCRLGVQYDCHIGARTSFMMPRLRATKRWRQIRPPRDHLTARRKRCMMDSRNSPATTSTCQVNDIKLTNIFRLPNTFRFKTCFWM